MYMIYWILLNIILELFFIGSTQNIVNGVNAKPGQFPYAVAVYYDGWFWFSDTLSCGGALINRNYVLSTQHCFSGYSKSYFYITAGFTAVNQKSHSQTRRIYKWFPRENRDMQDSELEHDIILLLVIEQFDYNSYVQAIPIIPHYKYNVTSSSECTAVGWGRTFYNENQPKVLKFINIGLEDGEMCKNKATRSNKRGHNLLCSATPRIGGKGVCAGDSGGPLICDEKLLGLARLVDITCGSHTNAVDFYVDLRPYRNWIRNSVGSINSVPIPSYRSPLIFVADIDTSLL